MKSELGRCPESDDEFLGKMSFRSDCISPLPIGMPPWNHDGVRRAPPQPRCSQRWRHSRGEVSSGALVVGALGEKAAIPRRSRLLNNYHLCQPPPSAL